MNITDLFHEYIFQLITNNTKAILSMITTIKAVNNNEIIQYIKKKNNLVVLDY